MSVLTRLAVAAATAAIALVATTGGVPAAGRSAAAHSAPAVVSLGLVGSGHAGRPNKPGHGTKSANLYYHGGGIETSPKVYLVFWGSQWTNNDPSGEASLLGNFFKDVGGSKWNNTVTQYCEGVSSGTYFCTSQDTAVGNQSSMLAGTWDDNTGAAPNRPSQNQLAAEAVAAAAHFGNTTATSNANVQYAIETAHGYSASGFGTRYCAWHSSTSSSYGPIAYANDPYITDAGASCGANFNGLGPDAGITIVDGHEFAESETDPFPSSGWLDGGGAEIGDKCAWNSATSVQSIGGGSFAVQPLWSNAANKDAGGCVLSY